MPQCGNLKIFLQLRFYLKSILILDNELGIKLQF